MNSTQVHQIRSQLKAQRATLSQDAQQKAALSCLDHLFGLDFLSEKQSIGLYLSNKGELPTEPLITKLWSLGKKTYLPVVAPNSQRQLLFLPYERSTRLVENRFGIFEPDLPLNAHKPIDELDVIFTPLVAFDSRGYRLGMGGGFYDTALEPWHLNKKGPVPIGLAYSFQQIDCLPNQPWDVPLPYVITEQQVHHWPEHSDNKAHRKK